MNAAYRLYSVVEVWAQGIDKAILSLSAIGPSTCFQVYRNLRVGRLPMMQGASPVSSQYLSEFFTPDPQQDPAPPGLPEQPLPPHSPHPRGQQTTSPALMPGISPGHVSAARSKMRRDDEHEAGRGVNNWLLLWRGKLSRAQSESESRKRMVLAIVCIMPPWRESPDWGDRSATGLLKRLG